MKRAQTTTIFFFLAAAAPAQEPETAVDLDVLVRVEAQGAAALDKRIATLLPQRGASGQVDVRLAALLRRAGRLEEAAQLLEELRRRPEPYASWAATQLARLRAPQERGGAPQDRQGAGQLAATIRALDLGGKERAQARQELRQLGVLAVPAILAAMPRLGPMGMSEALDLVLPHVDDKVVETLSGLLKSKDPIPQTIAASAAPRLHGDARVELGRLALESGVMPAQLHGVAALLGAGVDRDRCVATLDAARGSSSEDSRKRAYGLMGSAALRDVARVDGWLEAAIREDPGNAWAALDPWLERRRPDESKRRVAMLRILPEALATQMIKRELSKQPTERDYDLLFEGATLPGVSAEVVAAMPPDVVVRDPERLARILRRAPHSSNLVSGSAASNLLHIVASYRVEGVRDACEQLLDSPVADVRSAALNALSKVDPVWVLDNHERFLRSNIADVARRAARPTDMAWLFAAARNPEYSRYLLSCFTGPMFKERSDASNLATALDLLSDPATRNIAEVVNSTKAAIQRWFGPEHVTPTLQRLHEVPDLLLVRLIREHAAPRDVPALIAALRRRVERGEVAPPKLGSRPHVSISFELASTLGPLGGAGTEFLGTLLSHPVLGAHALRCMMEAKGFDRRATYMQLLDRADKATDQVLAVVLDDPWTARDEGARDKALAFLRALPASRSIHLGILSRVPEDVGRAAAVALVERVGTDDDIATVTAQQALSHLGYLRDPALIPTLALALRSRNYAVRESAVEQLGRTLDKAAAPYLISALGDEQERIRDLAEYQLKTIASILEKRKEFTERFRQLK